MGRRRRYRKDYRNRYAWSRQKVKQRRRSGWGMNLYRNPAEGKIAGVCAGLADHFDVAHWVMRLLFVVGFLFTGMLAVFAYFAGWYLLEPQHRHQAEDSRYEESSSEDASSQGRYDREYDERHQEYRPKKMFRYSEDSSTRLRRARERSTLR